MILLLLMVPYQIEAGYLEVINRNENIFRDGVKVYSEDLYIEGNNGIETSTYLKIEDSVYVKAKEIQVKADRIYYYPLYKKLYAGGNIIIWRNDTLKGDSLIYNRDTRSGRVLGNLRYIADSITVTGNNGFFNRDTIIVEGRPRFSSPSITVDADSLIYCMPDSIFLFLSNVLFEGSGISGGGERLQHQTREKISIILQSPYVLQKKDTIIGDRIDIDHTKNILDSYNGITINYTEKGRNIVKGDTIRVYYNKDSIDSVLVLYNAKGSYIEDETTIKEPD